MAKSLQTEHPTTKQSSLESKNCLGSTQCLSRKLILPSSNTLMINLCNKAILGVTMIFITLAGREHVSAVPLKEF